MSSKKAESENSVDAQLDSRIDRALKQVMHVTYQGDGLFKVASGSGNQYDVDVWDMNCTCRDAADGNTCKHLLHVVLVEGVKPGRRNGLFGDRKVNGRMLREMVESECSDCVGDFPCFEHYESYGGRADTP